MATVVGPLVEARGLDLEGVELSGGGDATVVRVVVDSDAGTDLDDLAELSRELSAALDGADPDPLGDLRYTLEVTSRGVDRPLTAPRHWRRAQGRKVTATLRVEGGADERVAGRVGRLDEAAGTVDVVVPARRGTWDVRALPLADVTAAVVGVDFSSPGPAELELCGLDGADARREGNR
ncbi:MAG: ribosome maturation factor RimP [Gordonia paraffinivorans]